MGENLRNYHTVLYVHWFDEKKLLYSLSRKSFFFPTHLYAYDFTWNRFRQIQNPHLILTIQISAIKIVKLDIFEIQKEQKLISRKIWLAVKFSNFHIVQLGWEEREITENFSLKLIQS